MRPASADAAEFKLETDQPEADAGGSDHGSSASRLPDDRQATEVCDRAVNAKRVQRLFPEGRLLVNRWRRTLYRQLWQHLGEVFHELARQKNRRTEEGHLMPDHVHMMLAMPPKYAISQVVGYFNGKSAIHLARIFGERKRNFVGQHFWARGYCVSTVARDETMVREYIRNQETADEKLGQKKYWQ